MISDNIVGERRESMFLSLTKERRELSAVVYPYHGYIPGRLVLLCIFLYLSRSCTISSPLRAIKVGNFPMGILNTNG